jgi:hypothetical protein
VADVKLTSPLVRVVRTDSDEPLEVQCANPDLVLWDMTRTRHKWPKFDEAPFLWLTFISWAGAKRLGLIGADYTFDQWKASVLDVGQVEDDAEDETGSPTQPGPEPG